MKVKTIVNWQEDWFDDEKEYIFCSLKCLEEYFGIEEWCVG